MRNTKDNYNEKGDSGFAGIKSRSLYIGYLLYTIDHQMIIVHSKPKKEWLLKLWSKNGKTYDAVKQHAYLKGKSLESALLNVTR